MRSNIGWYIGAAFLLVLLALGALVFAVWKPATPEIIIGMTMIVGVSVLVLVLFIIAAGFTAMKMNDPQ